MANRSINFMKRRIDILRPAFAVDVTTIRDRILTGYTSISTNVRCYIEPAGSEMVMNHQFGGTVVDRFSIFFPKNTNVKVNDVIKEIANALNGNELIYYDVVGVWNYSPYDFHVRADCVKKNYQQQ